MRSALRAGMRTRFSVALWNKWLARLNGPDPNDPQYLYLKSGIAQFRRMLAKQDEGAGPL